MDQAQMDRLNRRGDPDRVKGRATEQEQMGWLQEFLQQFALAWQLLWDDRVPLSTKLIPILTALYVVSPFDLIPGTIVWGLGQVDDLVIALVGLRMFVSLCPPEVVSEYLKFRSPEKGGDWAGESSDPEIIELEPREPVEGWQSATLRPSSASTEQTESRGSKGL